MKRRTLAIVGYGRMGHAVEQLAADHDFEVVAVVDAASGRDASPRVFRGADVAVEFTEPTAAPPNIAAAVAAHCPIVVGTTGWYASLPTVERAVHDGGGALFWSPNFSVGVAAFVAIAETAARLLGAAGGFDPRLIETHHAAKKDTPSGTAQAIAGPAAEAFGGAVPITSVRVGAVPGTHELLFDAQFEQIRLVHEARDRRVFAEGALVAARWLIGRTGVFTMRDLLKHPAGGR